MNYVILVGRLTADPVLKTLESGQKVTNIVLAVSRPFKNSEGNYDTDFIKCTLWEGVAQSTAEYCKKGNVIGIKGRLITKTDEVKIEFDDEVKSKNVKTMEVICERVTFLQSKN